MLNAKKILTLDYGSPEQIEAVTIWYRRFIRFAAAHPSMSERVWNQLHNHDIFYLARVRWMDHQMENEI